MNKTTLNKEKFSYEELSELKVCKHTAEWVRIYKSIQTLWGEIYDILETDYSDDTQEIFDKRFSEHFYGLLDETLNGVKDSIWESFGTASNHDTL